MAEDLGGFLSELLKMWKEGKHETVVMALAGHKQSTVVRFARGLDDDDWDGGRQGPRQVNEFIGLLEERGR